jgi:hypothetical protein
MISESEDRTKVIVTSEYHEQADHYLQLNNAVIAAYKKEYNNSRDFLEWVYENSNHLKIKLDDLEIVKDLLDSKNGEQLKLEIDLDINKGKNLKESVKVWVDNLLNNCEAQQIA